MAKATVADNSKRIDELKGCVDNNTELLDAVVGKIDTMMERQLEAGALREEFEKQKAWMGNGLSEKIAKMIATEMTNSQLQWLKQLLEEQKEENRAYGQQRDKERERKAKTWQVVVPSIMSFLALIGVALIGLL